MSTVLHPFTATPYFNSKKGAEAKARGLNRRRFNQDCKHNMPPFAGQNVVGPAGGLGVHGFKADAFFIKGLEPLGVWKTNPGTAAEYDKFRLHVCDEGEVTSGQIGKAGTRPFKAFTARANHYTFRDPLTIHADPAGPVAVDGLDFKFVGLDFHADGRRKLNAALH